jgi:hypothetical protein
MRSLNQLDEVAARSSTAVSIRGTPNACHARARVRQLGETAGAP